MPAAASTPGRSRLAGRRSGAEGKTRRVGGDARRVGRGPARVQVGDIQRARLLAGAVAAIDELGYANATVGKVASRARVSRRTFYELFANLDECLAAVLQDVVAQVAHELDAEGVAGLAWRERVRTGLAAILAFLDREPVLARVCVVQALRAGAPVQEARERVLAGLVAAVDEGRLQGVRGDACGALAAEGLVGAGFTIVHARLAHGESRPLGELLGELMGMIVLPYLGPAAARRERERVAWMGAMTDPARPVTPATGMGPADPLQGVRMRVTYRTAQVLEGVGEFSADGTHPSNRQLAAFAGIVDPGQISKLVRRLERLGLLENLGLGHAQGEPNAWRLTEKGALVTDGLRSSGPAWGCRNSANDSREPQKGR